MKLITATFLVLAVTLSISANGIVTQGSLEEYEQDFRTVEQLSVASGSINVDVVRENRNYRIEAQIDSRREVKLTERNGVIDITVSRLNSPFPPVKNELITLHLPEGIEIDINSGSGNVRVSDIDLEDLSIEIGSGNITIENVDAEMDLFAGSGNIEVSSSDGEKNLHTGSGTISVYRSEGDIYSGSGSGSHIYENTQGNIAAKAGSGDIELLRVKGTLDISVSSGDISGEQIMLIGNSDFESNSGTIKLELENRGNSLAFDLEGGSGTLRVNETRSSDSLRIGTGPIQIRGQSGSGNQRYRTR